MLSMDVQVRGARFQPYGVVRRTFTSHGIDWVIAGQNDVEGSLDGVVIRFNSWIWPTLETDFDEIERFLRGISVERWQPFLELTKFDSDMPAAGSSFPDEMTQCERHALMARSRPSENFSSIPGC